MVATAIGAAVGIGSALLGSSAQKKAAKTAATAAADNTAQNNALAQWMYQQNRGALSPWQTRGNAAAQAYNDLLGLGGEQRSMPERVQIPQGAPGGFEQQFGAADLFMPYGNQQTFANDYGIINGGFDNGRMPSINPLEGGWQYQQPMPSEQIPVSAPTTTTPGTGGTVGTASPYQTAFDNYRNSTGYQFRLNEGVNALGANWAARGLKGSGAALRSAQQYGQNIASGEFGNYMNMLLNQSNMGLSAANAQAGVGTNYVSSVTANNDNAASALANSALLRGQSNANLYGAIGNTVGNVFGSSFRGF